MAAAIKLATDHLKRRLGKRAMCIVTNGMPDDKKAALDAAAKAREGGIDIMVLGTDGADKGFLDQLASRKDLSVKVERHQLGVGIQNMLKLLPWKSE